MVRGGRALGSVRTAPHFCGLALDEIQDAGNIIKKAVQTARMVALGKFNDKLGTDKAGKAALHGVHGAGQPPGQRGLAGADQGMRLVAVVQQEGQHLNIARFKDALLTERQDGTRDAGEKRRGNGRRHGKARPIGVYYG